MTRQHATLRTRIVAAAAVALVGAGLLGGCASRPGAAAVVDGHAIRTSDVTAMVDELSPAYQGVSAQTFLGALIIEPTLTQLAADQGLGVSDEDGIARLTSDFESVGADVPDTFSPASIAIGRYQAVAARFTDAANADKIDDINSALNERIGALDVTVNPRFGTFDAATGQVSVPAARSWMTTGS